MKKFFFFTIAFALAVCSCKTKKVTPITEKINTKLHFKELIEHHQATKPQFETLTGSISVTFDNGEQSQSLSFSLRIKVGEAIWLSAPLGLAKAYLTPHKVQFYNKMNNTYFEGDYTLVEHFLGIKLQYESVENLLLGQIMNQNKYKMIPTEQGYLCIYKDKLIDDQVVINPNFRVGYVSTSLVEKDIHLNINYTYQSIENQLFPDEIKIITNHYNHQTSIRIELLALELNTNVKFPFKIPNGYKPLNIK